MLIFCCLLLKKKGFSLGEQKEKLLQLCKFKEYEVNSLRSQIATLDENAGRGKNHEENIK